MKTPPNPGGLVQLQDKIVDRFALTIYPYSFDRGFGRYHTQVLALFKSR